MSVAVMADGTQVRIAQPSDGHSASNLPESSRQRVGGMSQQGHLTSIIKGALDRAVPRIFFSLFSM